MLVAGKGLDEEVTNGAAARPVVAAREGRAAERESERREKGGDENEAPSLSGRGCNEPSSSEPDVDLSLRS